MKRRTQAEWLSLFESHTNSGQSATAFCKEQNVCPRYFSLRKKQLASADRSSSPLIKIQRTPALHNEASVIRLLVGNIELRLQNTTPDFIASLIQKLQ